MPTNSVASILTAETRHTFQKGALWLLLVTVGLSALLGMVALLSTDFGRTQAKILGTTATISAASLLAMASATGIGRKRSGPLPFLGIITAVLAGCWLITGIWLEAESESFWKLMGTFGVLAVAFSHGSLISAARLDGDHHLVQFIAYVSGALLAATIIGGIWSEPEADGFARLLGFEGIVVASSSIAVPVVARLGRLSRREDGLVRCRYCPGCGRAAEAPFAKGDMMVCSSCGMRARIEVLERSRPASGDTDLPGPSRPRAAAHTRM